MCKYLAFVLQSIGFNTIFDKIAELLVKGHSCSVHLESAGDVSMRYDSHSIGIVLTHRARRYGHRRGTMIPT
jgi:hypothetical protein